MKIKHIIEGVYDPTDFFGKKQDNLEQIVLNKATQLATYIKQNCKEWLAESQKGKKYVYRGYLNEPANLAFLKKVRQTRRPKDSGRKQHKVMDFMIQACGKTANRTNSVFTTSNGDMATDYGTVYVTIPVGKFHYTWHKDLDDWHGNSIWMDDDYLRVKQKGETVEKSAPEAQWKTARQQYLTAVLRLQDTQALFGKPC